MIPVWNKRENSSGRCSAWITLQEKHCFSYTNVKSSRTLTTPSPNQEGEAHSFDRILLVRRRKNRRWRRILRAALRKLKSSTRWSRGAILRCTWWILCQEKKERMRSGKKSRNTTRVASSGDQLSREKIGKRWYKNCRSSSSTWEERCLKARNYRQYKNSP
jgi:hypothetical protein